MKYKKSVVETLNLFIFDLIIGVGLGAFVSIGLTLGKFTPDTAMSAIIVILPIMSLYFTTQLFRKYGSIEIDATGIYFRKIFGKPNHYRFDVYALEAVLKSYKINYIHLAYGLVIKAASRENGKVRKLRAYGYNENSIEVIAKELKRLQSYEI